MSLIMIKHQGYFIYCLGYIKADSPITGVPGDQ